MTVDELRAAMVDYPQCAGWLDIPLGSIVLGMPQTGNAALIRLSRPSGVGPGLILTEDRIHSPPKGERGENVGLMTTDALYNISELGRQHLLSPELATFFRSLVQCLNSE